MERGRHNVKERVRNTVLEKKKVDIGTKTQVVILAKYYVVGIYGVLHVVSFDSLHKISNPAKIPFNA